VILQAPCVPTHLLKNYRFFHPRVQLHSTNSFTDLTREQPVPQKYIIMLPVLLIPVNTASTCRNSNLGNLSPRSSIS
jgi:hypothetical protein